MTWQQALAMEAWKVAVIVPLLACSAFFSGSETTLFSLSRLQLYRLGRGGRPGRIAAALMRRPRRVLNALLLGNMCVNVAYTGIAAVAILELRQAGLTGWMVAVASLGSLLALILFGEVMPKLLAIVAGPRLAIPVATALTVVERVTAPVLWVLEKAFVVPFTRILAPSAAAGDITAEELAALLDLSAKRGVIDRDVNALLQEIMALTDIRVADIMVPRVDMIAYEVGGDPAGLIEMFARTRLRKIPVYEKDIDHIVGVVHAKRLLLSPAVPLRELVARVPFVPEAANVERVLLQFRVTRTQMAIVVDEYGGTAGLVTLEDIMEEIVGDMPDTRSEVAGPAVQRLSDSEYLLDGDLAIHEWEDAFKIDLVSEQISTVGGFVISLLGRIPREGDQAEYRNLRFTVVSMRRRRIDKLRLELFGGQT